MAIDTLSHGHLQGPTPPGARTLGTRVKPILRLGMGVKHPEKGYPMKTDHFTVRGDERAVQKFQTVYGDQPKAVKLMVPSSLGLALDISYKAFVGGGDGSDGGRPLALGTTNFAVVGYAGGPDVLRVWKQDGTYLEVETAGLDELGKPMDEIAADLKIALVTTFTFTIPDVLGWGSFAQVQSKGKKSADNLVFKLSEIYSAFGSRAPWAFSKEEPPLLVIKPDTALMRMQDKAGDAKWAKTNIFVLDIVIPESFDDMQARLVSRHRELTDGGGAAAALYGPEGSPSAPAASEASATDARPRGSGGSVESAAADHQPDAVPVSSLAGAAADDLDIDDGIWEEAGPTDEEIEAAGAAKVPAGVHKDKTFAEVAEDENGATWFLSQLKKVPADHPVRAAIETFTRGRLPETWDKFVAWRAEQ